MHVFDEPFSSSQDDYSSGRETKRCGPKICRSVWRQWAKCQEKVSPIINFSLPLSPDIGQACQTFKPSGLCSRPSAVYNDSDTVDQLLSAPLSSCICPVPKFFEH